MWLLKEFFIQFRKPLFYFGLLALIILICIPLFTYASFAKDINNKQFLMNSQNPGLTLLDANGQEFFSFDSRNISFVPLSTIPLSIQHAVIAAEDKDFYTNPGFSIPGMARAFIVDVGQGQIVEGGSTITQQLVKNALLSPQKSFLRKYQEIIFAYLVTQKYSKNDILEMYLNSVYFGEGAFGVENAAERYFGVHANQLTLAQSALLASLIPAPSAYSPLSNNPSVATKRQEQILSDMQHAGFISQSQEQAAKNETLAYNPQTIQANVLAPHFALMVENMLFAKYGEENVIRSGLRVTTTLNRTWQEYAESVVQNQVAALAGDNATNGAAVVIDPTTGQIKAYVGSHNWYDPNNGKIDMVLSPRQPGSSFKPIVYSAAFADHIITPATILEDVPTTFPGGYKPHDYDGKYRGPVTVRRALSNSLNIPSVKVMENVGVTQAVSQAQSLGITTLKDPSNYGLSLVLGAANIPLLQLTDAYATFANGGVYHPTTPILKVQDKYGNVIDQYANSPQQILDPGVAFLISSILSDNKARAEEFGNLLTISRPAAVKTGTTENFRDALTLGYTPSLTIGVWVGNNDNAPMDNIAGSLGAAPIWKSLMEDFLAGTPVEHFTPPSDITQANVCPYALTKSPLASSSATYQEYFLDGTQPQDNCSTSSITPSLSPTVSPSSIPTIPTPTPTPTPTSFPTITSAPSPS